MNHDAELNEILSDPCTPYWAQDVIRVAMQKDPIDAESVLQVIAAAFSRRATKILSAG